MATVVKFLLDLISKVPKFSNFERNIICGDLISIRKSISVLEKSLLDRYPVYIF